MSSPVGAADRAMRSVGPSLLAPGAQKEQSGSFSFYSWLVFELDIRDADGIARLNAG
jgi:hypothetical protein